METAAAAISAIAMLLNIQFNSGSWSQTSA
jgi:hypothetical protein